MSKRSELEDIANTVVLEGREALSAVDSERRLRIQRMIEAELVLLVEKRTLELSEYVERLKVDAARVKGSFRRWEAVGAGIKIIGGSLLLAALIAGVFLATRPAGWPNKCSLPHAVEVEWETRWCDEGVEFAPDKKTMCYGRRYLYGEIDGWGCIMDANQSGFSCTQIPVPPRLSP